MTNNYSKDNNILLIKFRGYKPHPTEPEYWVKDDVLIDFELQYHTSWDWLIRGS